MWIPAKHSHLRDDALLRQILIECLDQTAYALARDFVHVPDVGKCERRSTIVAIRIRRPIRNHQDKLLFWTFHCLFFVSCAFLWLGSDPHMEQLLHVLPARVTRQDHHVALNLELVDRGYRRVQYAT